MEVVAELMAFNAMINFFSFAFSVTIYVLGAVGLYTIAKRRMINHPWLAWIPVGNAWILGGISDQYQFAVKQKKTGRRKVLIGLQIAMAAVTVVMVIVSVVMIFQLAMQVGLEEEYYYYNSASYGYSAAEEAQMVASALGIVLTVMLMALVVIVISVVYMVFAYISYYDLYMSCNPSNATVFLVLSIFFGFLSSIFVFACRNKDEGMQPQVPPVNPWQYPPQGYQPPYGQAPYQPPQPVYSNPVAPVQPEVPVAAPEPELTTIEPEPIIPEENT